LFVFFVVFAFFVVWYVGLILFCCALGINDFKL